MADYQLIQLIAEGESSRIVDLSSILVRLITRYNYSAACWTMDITDIDDNIMLAGLMLVPNVDILIPYLEIKELLGGLMLVELNLGDYTSDDLLGVNTALIWFPVGTPVVVPV